MFNTVSRPPSGINFPFNLPAPVGGLNTSVALMSMRQTNAVVLENFFPYPDRLETRPGYVSHVTGLPAIPFRLHVYSSNTGAEKIFATANTGIYDVTAAGPVGASVSAITNGKTSAAMLSTGAGHFLMLVNGQDSLRQYNGTTWSTVATFGTVATNTLSVVEVYKQRLFFAIENTLTLAYLGPNSITGSATTYELGAILRKGGRIIAMGTWTLDSGTGPDDKLAVATSEGEVAVFSGSDPSTAGTWSLQGVYYIGKPLGEQALYKYGGDLLFLSENGLYPLSQAVQSVAIERTRNVTDAIRSLFNDAATNFRTQDGWQVIAQPDTPFLLVNVPSVPVRTQFVMHAQTGSWAVFSGWNAYSFARANSEIYFGTANTIFKVSGSNDAGANITSTLLQAYTKLGYPKTKQIVSLKPYFEATAGYLYNIGVASDFSPIGQVSPINKSSGLSAAIWGTSLWGAATWSGAETNTLDWQTAPDSFSLHKALYIQVVNRLAPVSYLGCDGIGIPGGNF